MTTLDTRDLDSRLDELEALQSAIAEAEEILAAADTDQAKEEAQDALDAAQAEFDDDAKKELAELEEAKSEISEWTHGETLILERDWVDYVQELLADIGDLPKDLPHYIVIDWDKTAENIKADYVEVTYLGDTYLARSC